MGTPKQNKFAESLGIDKPEDIEQKELGIMIDEKLGKTGKAPSVTPNLATQSTTISTVLNVTSKPHSYELGKSGARHKIYYEDIKELEQRVQELKDAGFIESDMDAFNPPTEK